MDKIIKVGKNVLIAFILVTIGFSAGKEVTARRYGAMKNPIESEAVEQGDKVVVYYLHTTFRCVTCNEIERLAETLVTTAFADELEAGRIEWKKVNFQEDTEIAKRYRVVSSCVVVAHLENGRETDFKRLDDVWMTYQNPEAFNTYVASAIEGYMEASL